MSNPSNLRAADTRPNFDAQFDKARNILATCPETNTQLVKVLIKKFMTEWDEHQHAVMNEMMCSHSPWAPGNDWAGVSDYYMRPRHRTPMHRDLWSKHESTAREIHLFLFYLASGLGAGFSENLVVPRYLRNIVSTAYHASYVDEKLGLVYWETVLKLDHGLRDQVWLISGGLSFSFLAMQMLEELKALGRFVDEPITDEIVTRAQEDKQPPWMDDVPG